MRIDLFLVGMNAKHWIVYCADTYFNGRGVIAQDCSRPNGAFYLIARLPVEDAEAFSIFMLRDFEYKGETVMVAPAEGFYESKDLGRDQVRIAYVLNTEDLKKACECLRKGLEVYQVLQRGME